MGAVRGTGDRLWVRKFMGFMKEEVMGQDHVTDAEHESVTYCGRRI